ncbi:retrotransposon protein, putative, ty1-copia subclass [Tanacetum coccineum]|uniref:Retrotransposon protein, putative, ty1-copia subclass n=1 Tax=Tanacetum coccineum TaxID=301880 RepID=A0ABQ4XQE4_9ASTR
MTRAKFDIEKFDGTGDFGLWKIKMHALLIQHGCEAALEVLPADMEAQTKVELNKKAHSDVILCLGNKVPREVTGETTATGVWSNLETLYMTKSLANKLYPKKKLYTFYMPTGRKISEHIDEFNKIVLDLTNIEDVMATLNSKEIKKRSKAKGDDGEGLYVRGRTDRRDSRQSRGKSRSKSRGGRLKCYICQSEDHLKRNCPKNNRKKSTGYVKKDEQPSSSGSTYDDSEVMMVMSAQAQALLDWIMDSGCSYHMTPRLDILFDFLECDGGSVQLGDNRECKIRGIGKVRIQLRDGSSFVLHNVRYIPELKRNLISLGTLEKEGFTVKLQSGKVKVINGSRVVLSGIRRDNCVYSLDGHAMAGELNASVEEKDNLAQVWHKRLGHISEAGLNVLEKQGLFGKKSLGKLDFCDNYVLGKSHRVRSVWVYIVRFKHEAFGKFKEWKQLVENQTGRTVKKLRTDNGLEFFAGTPQHNGPAERMNRTLMYKVRCLLIQSGLPKTFWVEATYMAAYLINRSPSTTIEKKTPTEMCLGHPSDYEMLRIFDCVAYPHDKQGKLDPRAVKCVLLGYPEGVKGYRLYRLDNKLPKIVTNRNVIFNESVMYKDTLRDSDAGADNKGKKDTHEPLTYQEAFACEDSSKWKAAMKEEMDSLRKNKTWELVDHPAGQKLVSCKWLFKIKEGIEGVQKPRYKARLVARGFTQRAGIDYNEVFSPVVRHTSIRVILALTACKDYELEQLDVKTAFLHGNLEEVIYMRQPPGYEQGNKVCLLKKSLYGLKQSPRQWYRRFDEYMLSNGFKRSSYDSCVYYRSYAPGEYIYLLLYVDDMLIACKSKAEIGSTKSLLKKEFDMKELGEAKKILGMEIVRDQIRKILRVSQSVYVSKILNNFRIDNGKSVKMPLDGHFKLSLKDCPVRDCDVERMSKVPYANAILKYLWGIANAGLVYGTNRGKDMDVTGFVDSDYAKDPDKGRSITDFAFLVQGCVVGWKATLQHVVALSTTEAEYIALTEAVNEAICLRGLLEELGVELNTVAVNCDNHDAIHLLRNHVFYERTKHINVRYHFIREVLEAKTVNVLKVGTEHNVADALTKVVPGLKLQHCLELLNVGVG